ncbi:MAG: NAD(P)/FAD-dependent oxidoreductase [Candidatus Sulfotelmatobacter sp.]
MNATDVFVIGGGPAGLAAAIAARQRGFRVTVADGAEMPIDKACGEGLMPDGLAAVQPLGIQLPVAEAPAFHGIRFVGLELSAEAAFPGGGRGLAIRRTALHRVMSERAAQMGVELLWRTAVTGIEHDRVRLGKNSVRARWIIGADGPNSRVRKWAGLESHPRSRLRYAYRQHFRLAPWTDYMEIYWGKDCQGYATAVGPDQVCVAVASHNPQLRVLDCLHRLPRLEARLRGSQASSLEKGALTGNRTLRRVSRGNVVLIGDASGTVDAITGEGLGLAFSQAVVLAECLEADKLEHYHAEHQRLALRPRAMARLMLTLDGRPGLQNRTLHAFRKHPNVFRRLLALHVGAVPPGDLVWDGLTLGWGLLTA